MDTDQLQVRPVETAIVDTVHISQLRQLRASPPELEEELMTPEWIEEAK